MIFLLLHKTNPEAKRVLIPYDWMGYNLFISHKDR